MSNVPIANGSGVNGLKKTMLAKRENKCIFVIKLNIYGSDN